jgi:hypothetical protein
MLKKCKLHANTSNNAPTYAEHIYIFSEHICRTYVERMSKLRTPHVGQFRAAQILEKCGNMWAAYVQHMLNICEIIR